jgi:hypothetical protein
MGFVMTTMKNSSLSMLYGISLAASMIACEKITTEIPAPPQDISSVDTTIKVIRLSAAGGIETNPTAEPAFLIVYSNSACYNGLAHIKYGTVDNGYFMAVGNGGVVSISSNGSTGWRSRNSNTASDIYTIGKGGVGGVMGGNGVILTEFNMTIAASAENSKTLYGITMFGRDSFHIYGAMMVGSNDSSGHNYPYAAYYAYEGWYGFPLRKIREYTITAESDNFFKSVDCQSDICAAVGTNGIIYTSRGIAYTSGSIDTLFQAVNWTERTSPTTNTLNAVKTKGWQFVAVGNGGTILTSNNGITWSPQQSHTTQNLNSIAYKNDRWIVVGDGGTILTSNNGREWTAVPSGTIKNLRAVAPTY